MDWLDDLWEQTFLETLFPFLDPLFGVLIIGNALFWGAVLIYGHFKK